MKTDNNEYDTPFAMLVFLFCPEPVQLWVHQCSCWLLRLSFSFSLGFLCFAPLVFQSFSLCYSLLRRCLYLGHRRTTRLQFFRRCDTRKIISVAREMAMSTVTVVKERDLSASYNRLTDLYGHFIYTDLYGDIFVSNSM